LATAALARRVALKAEPIAARALLAEAIAAAGALLAARFSKQATAHPIDALASAALLAVVAGGAARLAAAREAALARAAIGIAVAVFEDRRARVSDT
jgi:hypothetical protein